MGVLFPELRGGRAMGLSSVGLMFLAVVVLTMAVYAVYGLLSTQAYRPEKANSLIDYTTAPNSLTPDIYSQSSIAYFLQISTTFYFVYFGYHYGFGNSIYLVSWALGIYFFSTCAAALLSVRSEFLTFSKFLAGASGRAVEIAVALVVCASFLGLLYVEVYYVTEFTSNVIAPDGSLPNRAVWWIIFFMILSSVFLCSAFGGLFRTSVTDRFQLNVSYCCFAIVFSILTPFAYIASGHYAVIASICIIIIYAVIRWTVSKRGVSAVTARALDISIFINCLSLAGTLILAAPAPRPGLSIPNLFSQLDGWGYLTVGVFALVNLSWQFCDASNYQRATALSLSNLTDDAKIAELKRSLRVVMISSPITWGLGIFFGIFLKISGLIEPAQGKEFETFLDFLHQQSQQNHAVFVGMTAVFLIGIVSVMMSTADSAVMTYLQAFSIDLGRGDRSSLLTYIVGAAIAFSGVMALAWLHKGQGVGDILTITSGANAQLFALTAPALVRLAKIHIPKWLFLVTLAASSSLCWYATLGAWSQSVPEQVAVVLPFIVVGISTSPLFIWALIAHRFKNPGSSIRFPSSERS
jgi:hypothetical protein